MSPSSSPGNFKISDVPLASSSLRASEADEASELPQHSGKPLLLAIARNPRTLFLCWSVDWPAQFGSEIPADRRAHVKLTSRDSEQMEAVEPLRGNWTVSDLEPGGTYAVEIGYYAPANHWTLVVSDEVTMPLRGATNDETPVDVATVPFHLSFQRLVDLFGSNDNLIQRLADFEERTARAPLRSQREEEILRALGLTADELKIATAIREALTRIKIRPRVMEHFPGSSLSL
jgi:Domain of unknown function (DUF4912)